MKRMVVKNLCLATAVFLSVTLFAGCGTTGSGKSEASSSISSGTESAASKVDTSKPVVLKMHLLGDGATDAKLVYDEINKKLKADINATVEISFFGWSDWQTKYQLLLSSGEDYDIIVSAWWSSYADNARKGAFWELTDERLNTYAPQTMKSSPSTVLDSGKVDGKLFVLPMNYNEFSAYGYIVRGDLMKKYNIPDIKTIDDFGVYLDALAKNEKSMIPYDTGNSYDNWGLSILGLRGENEWYSPDNLVLSLNMTEKSPKLFVESTTTQALEFYKKMKVWKEKGYWSTSALVNKTTSKDSFLNGKSGACISNLLEAQSMYQSVVKSHPDWDLRFYPGNTTKATYANSYISNGISINAKSKNPERALMMLDLFKNNEDYFNLTTYGIKGKHYDLNSKNEIVILPDSTNFAPDAACPWGWREERFYKSFADGLPNYSSILASYKKRMVSLPAVNFIADQTKIQDKIATFTNIGSQYELPLRLGFSKDVEKDLKSLNDQLKSAGLESYMSEYQVQLDKFYSNYGK